MGIEGLAFRLNFIRFSFYKAIFLLFRKTPNSHFLFWRTLILIFHFLDHGNCAFERLGGWGFRLRANGVGIFQLNVIKISKN